jgi:hypothetical protein
MGMSSSGQRILANRANAGLSMGPACEEGKALANLNVTRHGLVSTRLFLNDEAADEYQDPLSDLQCAFLPVGAFEAALVERIAVGLWRQLRLVTPENVAFALSRNPKQIVGGVSRSPTLDATQSWVRTATLEVRKYQPRDMVSAPWAPEATSRMKVRSALKPNGMGRKRNLHSM